MFFPRGDRLLKAADYRWVFKRPEKSRDECFTILWRKNGLNKARLGLAISKKSVQRAVDRNRIKRLIRESFRQQSPPLPSVDIVVLGRYRIGTRSNREILHSLAKHWEHLIRHG